MRLPKLTGKQLNRISEILMGVGHIALASVVVPNLIDKSDNAMLLWGLVTAIVFWILSIILVRKRI